MNPENTLYRLVKASERLPKIYNNRPKHYFFRNDVNDLVLNIWTEFINDWPPIITRHRLDWQWLEEVPPQEQEEVWDDFRNQWINGQEQELAHSGFGYEKAKKIAAEQWEELKQQYILIKK